MTALYIILGIIAFFVILLSVKFCITVHYEGTVEMSVSWLFIKIGVIPFKEKKKKEKKQETQEESKEEEKKKPKKQKIKEPKNKDNIFKRFYHNQGFSGVIALIQDAARILGGMFGSVFRAFIFDELYVSMTVGSYDPEKTAEKYGKTCAAVFPAMGVIVNNMRAKKYNVKITPDFINGSNSARFHTKISVRPIRLINAVIVMVFKLLFKVVIKFLKGSKAENKTENKTGNKKIESNSKSVKKAQ